MKFHLLGAACTAIMTTAASAATLLVPAQHATIQDAIDAAASGDVIVVDPGIYHESLLINGKNLVLESSSSTASVVIDGGSTRRCLECRNLSSATSITGFTFQNGNTPLPMTRTFTVGVGLGGGAFLNHADVKFESCTFRLNDAIEGGGLYSWLSQPTLNECSFEENSAMNIRGGALVINTIGRGFARFTDCNVTNNTSGIFVEPYPLRRKGARMRGNHVAVTFTNTTFTGNTNSALGAVDANLELEACHFKGNKDNGLHLGATPHETWTADINDCTFTDTTADQCVMIGDYTASVTNCTFKDLNTNTAAGAIDAGYLGSGTLLLHGNEFTRVRSGRDGGAIKILGCNHAIIEHCAFNQCIAVPAIDGQSKEGGAIYANGSTVDTNHCEFTDCFADNGGSIFVRDSALNMESCTISGSRGYVGAAIYSCAIITGGSIIRSQNCTFTDCVSTPSDYSSHPTAVFFYNSTNVNSSNDTYDSLHAEGHGDVISISTTHGSTPANYLHYDSLRITNCSAEHDHIIDLYGALDVTFDGCMIRNNICGDYGDLIRMNADWLFIHGCEFATNSASAGSYRSYGHFMVYTAAANFTHVSDTTFCRNRLVDFSGPWVDGGGVQHLPRNCR